jgi:putative hemolysin
LIGDLVLIFALILVKGLIWAVYNSLIFVDIKRNKFFADKNSENTKRLEHIMESAEKQINTASIVNSLLGLSIGFLLANNIFADVRVILSGVLTELTKPAVYVSAIVIICVAAFFFAFFSIILPKIFAERMADKILFKLDWIIRFLYFIFIPFELAVSLSNRFIGLFIKESPDDDVSEAEILKMVDAGGESGSIDEDEKEMINNIFEFDDKTAVEVATHRKDIVALSVDASLDEILNLITTEKYTRIPVYKDSIDNVIGILHVKDLMNYIIKKGKTGLDIKNMLMEPFFVPFTKKADELFEEMQSNKIHICIVVDEYGGTAGIVTMEDLIEEVMGNILDEYDEEEQPEIAVLSDNNIRIDGTTSLDDVAEQLDIEMPLDEYETLSGFIIGQLGSIPSEDDTPVIEYKGYRFCVDKVEEKRIAQATVTKMDVAEEN